MMRSCMMTMICHFDEVKQEECNYTVTQTTRDIIVIYSPRMAGYLMLKGFYLVGVQPNLKRPGKNCFSFFSSQMLKEAMEDYLNHKDELEKL